VDADHLDEAKSMGVLLMERIMHDNGTMFSRDHITKLAHR
jgi:hypothetical protein